MSEIRLEQKSKQELVQRLQRYMGDELEIEVGGFDAEFLLDFFAEQVGCFYYNQGLADALSAIENKVQEFSDLVCELEKDTDIGAGKKNRFVLKRPYP